MDQDTGTTLDNLNTSLTHLAQTAQHIGIVVAIALTIGFALIALRAMTTAKATATRPRR